MSGELRFPTTIEGDPISTRLDQGAVRALGIADWAVSRRVGAAGRPRRRGRLGAHRARKQGRCESRPASPTLCDRSHVATSAFRPVPVHAPRARSSRASAADFDCFNTRYLVQRETGDDVVFHPWRLRPMAVLGIRPMSSPGSHPRSRALLALLPAIALACSSSPATRFSGGWCPTSRHRSWCPKQWLARATPPSAIATLEVECPAAPIPFDFYALIDRSQSMQDPDFDKWELLVTSFTRFLQSGVANGTNFGVGFFPMGVRRMPAQRSATLLSRRTSV